jgi:molecular chaperone GrpE
MAERKHKHPETNPNHAEEEVAASKVEAEEFISGIRGKTNAKAAPAEPVGIPVEEYEAVQKQLEESQEKAKEYFDGWQRERADFANYKRRIDREQINLSQNIAAEVIKKYLLVLDDLDRAMKMRPTQGEMSAWADGIDLIYRKLQNILDSEGIKRIPAEDEEFNPLRHEAISSEECADCGSGEIIGVVQEGYTLGDRVLRPARVRVAR